MRHVVHTKKWLRERLVVSGECLEWTGCKTRYGYGLLHTLGKTKQAHRLSWELFHGAIPTDMCVLHRCDNPSCCRPSHLFLGTQQDNIADMVKKGRQRGARAARHNKSKLTEAMVLELRRRWKHESHESKEQLAAEFGVSFSTAKCAANGRTWKHLNVDKPGK